MATGQDHPAKIRSTYETIRRSVPAHVAIVLACKKRHPDEVRAVIEAGATDLGQNYVQEAESSIEALGDQAAAARWHMIGPLQKNKINKALRLFDVVQTVSSTKQAREIQKRAAALGKHLSVYIEVNIGEESAKSGVPPERDDIVLLAREIAPMENLHLEGLMTMGPFYDDPEAIRPYFRKTREIYDHIRSLGEPGMDLSVLSMGMSDSYEVAIEEGSNMIRLGTIVFGPRPA
jgi:pyridoxal phosphate enzyme (YggS family)